jgi:hypothetical protein
LSIVNKFQFALTKKALYVLSTGAVVISVISVFDRLIYQYPGDPVIVSYRFNITSGNVTFLVAFNNTNYVHSTFLLDYQVARVWSIVYSFVRDFGILIYILVLNILILRIVSRMVKTRR